MREAHVIFFFSSLNDKKTFEEICKICKTLNRKESGEQPLVFFFLDYFCSKFAQKERRKRYSRERLVE